MKPFSLAAGLLLLACLAAGAAQAGTSADGAASLYERLGGAGAVEAIATELVDTASTDPRTRRSFEGVTLSRTRMHIAVMLCQITGGGCVREGDSMRDIHAGLGIEQREFHALVEQLRSILQRHSIGLRERNELLALLAPMRRDVVEK
ncbi:MAG: group 1 truncated hemoglobin [Pseudomonadota bacterium]